MFDLEKSIADWRKQMLAAGIKTPAPLEELESHLRDDLERQMQSGVAAQSAFALAVQHLGPAGSLKHEFETAGASSRRLSPKLLGIYCYVIAASMLLVSLGELMMKEMTLIETAAGILLALYVGGVPRWHGLLANPRSRWVQAALRIGFLFVYSWPIWAVFGLLPGGTIGNLIPSFILPAWVAMVLACFVYCPALMAKTTSSMSGKNGNHDRATTDPRSL